MRPVGVRVKRSTLCRDWQKLPDGASVARARSAVCADPKWWCVWSAAYQLDAHESVIDNHTKMAATIDQPVAALIHDLKQRGMLDDTLLVWCTEFGRSPATEGINRPGRDHHPDAFTFSLPGRTETRITYGASDEIGYTSDNPSAHTIFTLPSCTCLDWIINALHTTTTACSAALPMCTVKWSKACWLNPSVFDSRN